MLAHMTIDELGSLQAVPSLPQDALSRPGTNRGRAARSKRRPARGERPSDEPTRVLGYVRVSSHEQRDRGLGLEAQREAIVRFCQQKGWRLARRIYEDPGVSGARADEQDMVVRRPGLLSMLAAIDGTIKYIICLNTSRLWRSPEAAFIIQRELKRLKVDVRSVEQTGYSIRKPDPESFLVNGITELLDSYMRLEIVTKLTRGRRMAAAKGQFPGGGVSYGYSHAGRGTRALVVNPAEAEVVRDIFRMHRRRLSALAIAAELNARKVKTRQGREWSHKQIIRIVARRRFYEGRMIYAGGEVVADGLHPPVLGSGS